MKGGPVPSSEGEGRLISEVSALRAEDRKKQMVTSRKQRRAEEISVGGGAFSQCLAHGQQRDATQSAWARLQQWDHGGGDGGWKS